MSDQVIREISFMEHIPPAVALTTAHWQETESHAIDGAPNLALDLYRTLEAMGELITFGAFDAAGNLVGYAVAAMGLHMHYSFRYAQHDALFVAPEFRRGSLGVRLMRALEDAAKARGARFMLWHAKPGSTFEKLLTRTGCVLEEAIYRKEF